VRGAPRWRADVADSDRRKPVAAVKPVCIEVASNQVGQVRMKLVWLYQNDRQALVSDVNLSAYDSVHAVALFDGEWCKIGERTCKERRNNVIERLWITSRKTMWISCG
jgi:hypothetical protein